MKLHLLQLSLASGALGGLISGLLDKRGCNSNNCARAVTGARFELSVQAEHTADCSSFMIQTITPATPTTYVTITPTSYSVVGAPTKRAVVPEIEARQQPGGPVTVNPTSVPSYATACAGPSGYSSACLCAGITQTTTYAPTPATATSTVYAATSVIPVCDPAKGYGAVYNGGVMDPAAGRQNLVEPSFNAQQCCSYCYQYDSNCLAWYIAGPCYIVYESTGTETPTDYCLTGRYALNGPQIISGGYGVGPCLYPVGIVP